VKRGDIIAVVDTQKGLIDIEVFDEGTVRELLVHPDQKVPVGTVMALLSSEKEMEQAAETSVIVGPTQQEESIYRKEAKEKLSIAAMHHGVKASPLARRIAEGKGIDLSAVAGTGEGGVITREDVENVITGKMAPADTGKKTAAESIRMAVASAMSRANREIPQYYLETKADMRNALDWLKDANRQRAVEHRLLPVVLFIKAVAMALKDVPDLNGYWENGFQKKDDINIGFVVSLRTGGIVIPAFRGADKKSLDELMGLMNDMISRARGMKLRSSELSESTITVTSLGDNQVETVYGIIYPPQVALVGFGSITSQPWAENGMLGVRPVLSITLAGDHRATDGSTGSRFLVAVKHYLEEPELML